MGTHGRQPEAVAWLLVGFDMVLRYWKEAGALDDPLPLWTQAQEVLFEHSKTQQQTIRDEEPVGMFLNALNELRMSGEAVVLDLTGGGSVRPQENCVGYEDATYTYLLPGSSFGAVQEHFRRQGTPFLVSRPQLWKRMADVGMIEVGSEGASRMKHIPGLPNSQRVIWFKRQFTGAFEV